MTKKIVLFLAALLSLQPLLAQAPQPAETRIALVVGNGAYPNAPLKNPVNDAKDLAAALKGLGFSVSLVTDGDLPAMSRAIRDFGNAIKRPDAVALFYYSGHGIQYKGANYLIPANSDIQDPDELSFSSVNADQVYAKMESSGDRTNIVILDACRNNPFPGAERSSERGLAIVGSAPPQSIIVYATAPGKTAQDGAGRNGVFTQALLEHLAEPGLDAELMIRKVREDVIAATGGAQVPWHNSSISGRGFAFAPPKSGTQPPPEPAKASIASADQGVDAAAGNGILTITSDPPGMWLVIDDGETQLATPASVELPAGAHSFEPRQTVIDHVYYAGQPLQWIAVSAGSEIRVPIKIKPETASLKVRLAPPGYRVLVGEEEIGETPIDAAEVKAGQFEVRFEKEGEPPRRISAVALPGGTATVSWGGTKETAIQLPRAAIKLDGLASGWDGIDPLVEPNPVKRFMGDEKYGIKAVYMCRDDKYLYWRVDFKEIDPLLKPPRGVGKGVNLQLGIWKESSNENFSIVSQFASEMNSIRYFIGGVAKGSWKEMTDGSSSGKHNKNLFVGRVDWAWIQKHFSGVFNPSLTLANQDANWNWIQSTAIQLNLGWVDFGK
jgi:hypothetical protein